MVLGFPLELLLLFQNTVSSAHTWKLQLQGSRAWTQQLWLMSSVAPRHVGSFWTRDGICVPCIFRQIPIHCTSREVPQCILLSYSACMLSCFSRVRLFANPWIEVSTKLETYISLAYKNPLDFHRHLGHIRHSFSLA